MLLAYGEWPVDRVRRRRLWVVALACGGLGLLFYLFEEGLLPSVFGTALSASGTALSIIEFLVGAILLLLFWWALSEMTVKRTVIVIVGLLVLTGVVGLLWAVSSYLLDHQLIRLDTLAVYFAILLPVGLLAWAWFMSGSRSYHRHEWMWRVGTLLAIVGFVFCLGLLPVWALDTFAHPLVSEVFSVNTGPRMALAASMGLALVLNAALWKVIDASRDYSGASERSSRWYWATLDGKYSHAASKAQMGEWHPPMGATLLLLLVNALLLALGTFAGSVTGVEGDARFAISYAAYLLLVVAAVGLFRLVEVPPEKRSRR